MTATSIRQIATMLEEREKQVIRREHEIAAAAQTLSQSAAVQAAWAGGTQQERQRISAMITIQLEQLNRAGLESISLRSLLRRINQEAGE